ncbi:MAG: YraN family protein [Gammaproteobacteria bacterium]|nr:YraN family protein [Gammaproteobacteria bacterium]MDH5514377.1 YraN family protein [Gammaproteobacteria bacterium]
MAAISRGRAAEDRACAHLLSAGLILLERNYYCRRGEIDLVLQDADTLVFVEVRYRRQNSFGSALESVDRRKQARLIAAAQHYLQARTHSARLNCRFDVVAITGQEKTLEWIRHAFTVDPQV